MSTEEIKKERLALLDRTAAHFNTNNRAYFINTTNTQSCVYYDEDTGNRCAIGREVPLELAKKLPFGDVEMVEEHLPDELLALGIPFLMEVQGLHDHEGYWDEKGLNKAGMFEYRWIVEMFID